jgi:hypothetical protein
MIRMGIFQSPVRPAPRYGEETYAACFVLQTFAIRSYEFTRHSLIHLPQVKHVDAHFKDALDVI